jgi:hypothetical protein
MYTKVVKIYGKYESYAVPSIQIKFYHRNVCIKIYTEFDTFQNFRFQLGS